MRRPRLSKYSAGMKRPFENSSSCDHSSSDSESSSNSDTSISGVDDDCDMGHGGFFNSEIDYAAAAGDDDDFEAVGSELSQTSSFECDYNYNEEVEQCNDGVDNGFNPVEHLKACEASGMSRSQLELDDVMYIDDNNDKENASLEAIFKELKNLRKEVKNLNKKQQNKKVESCKITYSVIIL